MEWFYKIQLMKHQRFVPRSNLICNVDAKIWKFFSTSNIHLFSRVTFLCFDNIIKSERTSKFMVPKCHKEKILFITLLLFNLVHVLLLHVTWLNQFYHKNNIIIKLIYIYIYIKTIPNMIIHILSKNLFHCYGHYQTYLTYFLVIDYSYYMTEMIMGWAF